MELIPGEWRSRRRRLRVVCLGVALVVLAGAVPLLDDVGPTWDLVNAEYDYGGLFFHAVWTGDAEYLNFSAAGRRVPLRYPSPNLLASRGPPHGAFALAGMVSGASARWLWTDRPWVAPMAVFHLPVVLCTALLAALVAWVAGRRLGLAAGLGAAGALLVMPRFVGEALGNLREVPEALLALSATWVAARALGLAQRGWTDERAALAVLEGPDGMKTPRGSGLLAWVGAGVLLGLGMAQGPQVPLTTPVVVALAALLIAVTRRGSSSPSRDRGSALYGVPLALAVAPIVWWGCSPWYWSHTAERLTDHLAWIARLAQGDASWQSWETLALTTPLPVLGLALIGLGSRRVDVEWRLLWLLGVLVPLIRTTWPGVRVHDGVRPLFVALPALALLAGTGFAVLVTGVREVVRSPRVRRVRALALGGLLLGPCAVACVEAWPFASCSYNTLALGLRGAQAAGRDDAADTSCASYWQALDWMSEHAEWGADLLVPIGEHVAQAAAPLRLRPDLDVLGRHGPGPGVPLYVLSTTRAGEHHGVVVTADRVGRVVAELGPQGGVACRLWRIDDETEARLLVALWRELHDRPQHRLLAVLREASAENPELVADVNRVLASAPGARLDELAAALRPFVPERLHAELDELLTSSVEP